MLIFYFFQQYLFVLYKSLISKFLYNTKHLTSVETVNLVAFVFAGNAVILGNAVGITYYMSYVSIRKRKRFKSRAILNNQAFLVGCYFFWYFEVVTFIGESSGLLYIYGVFEYAWEVCVLLFIVLFLESVKELRRSFKGYTITSLLLHLLLISGLIFMCFSTNKSTYNKLGAVSEKLNPYVSIPRTTDTVSYENQVLQPKYGNRCRIPVKVLQDSGGVTYWLNRNEISITDLISDKHECRYGMRDREPEFFVFADGTIKYNRLKELENIASLKGMFSISYAIYATTVDNEFVYSKVLYTSKTLHEDTMKSMPPPPPRAFNIENYLRDKKEKIVSLESFEINGDIDRQKVYEYFQKSVSDSTFFNLKINKEVTLQEYLDFMITYKQSVYDLRDEQKRMNNALNDYKINEREKYPFNIIEEIEE